MAARGQTLGLNFTGVTLDEGKQLNNNNGYAPPDNNGGVGPNDIVQLINGAFAVYDKTTGVRESLMSARQFWTAAGVDPGNSLNNLGVFNQRILYDPSSQRWIAVGLSGQSQDNNVLVARSNSSDPLGGWKAVSFLGNNDPDVKFVDYTRMGVDADGVYIATNNFLMNAPGYGLAGISVFSLPKADLLAATPSVANMTRFDQVPQFLGDSVQPIIDFGPSKGHAPIIGTSPSNVGEYLVRSDLTGTAGPGATLTEDPPLIPVADYYLPTAAAQPDGTRSIGTIDQRISGNVYEVGNVIYATHDTMVDGHVAVSWIKLNEQTNQVIQEGVLSDPRFDFFQPSIAANAQGDIVISFTRSGSDPDGNLSAVAVVGHTLGDVTTFGNPFLLKASDVGNYHYLNGRWGDYMTTVVDPSDPRVFWTFQQYASASNAWATQITQIFVPEPASWILATLGLVTLCVVAWRRPVR